MMKSCSEQLYDMATFARSSPDSCMLVPAHRLAQLAQDVEKMERQLDKLHISPMNSNDYLGWGKGKDE